MTELTAYADEVTERFPHLTEAINALVKPSRDAYLAYMREGEATGIYHAGDFNLDSLETEGTNAIYDLEQKAERETYMALHVSKANAQRARKIYR